MRIALLNFVLFTSLLSTQAQSLVTAEIFHGNDAQGTQSVTSDANNNIICATGFWDDLDGDPGPGTANLNAFGSQDVAITKLDPAGNLIWTKQIGGTGFETPQVIEADASGNIYVFGYFNGTIDMNPGPGTTNLVSAGSDDLYCGKYDVNGSLLWAVRTGGTGTEQNYGFDLDASGDPVIYGYFQNTVDFDPGPATANLTAGFAGSDFILKLNADGTYNNALLMASAYGNKMTIDASDNIYLTGLFWETVDFDPGPAVHNLVASGFSADAFVLKLNSANVYQWAIKISGASSEQGVGIAYDENSDAVYVSGFFEGTIDINPGPAVQNLVSLGYVDAFIGKFNGSDGALIWGKLVGGVDYQNLTSIAVSSTGSIWATGSFANTVDFDPGPAVHNLTSNGFQDIIKLNWDADGNYIDAQKIGGTNSDYGAWIDIDDEGAILISGIFEGLVDFDPGDVTFNLNSAFTGWDGYIAKYCTVYTINNYVSICEGDSYFAGGANQTEPGDYYDYYTPVEGCDSIIITHLSINNPVVNLGANYAICSGTTTTLNAGNPGATYLWSTGATTQTITVGTAGTYSVTITDPAGCVASDAITISVNPSPTVNLGADISACADETVVLNAGNPGANYLWNTGATTQTINANTTGTYSVTVTNGFGCFASDVINVNIHALPTVELGTPIDFCTGENVTLDAGNPGATYLWSTGATTQTITTSTAGTYFVTVTNAFGCDKTDNITLTEHAAPVVDLGADIIACADELIILDAENVGANYAWNTGAATQTLTVTESGNYGVVVTNAFGCSDNDLVNIIIHDLPVLDLGTTLQFCENTDITLDAENIGSTYLWNTGATTQTITTAIPGTFSVTVTNANGCIAFDEVDVSVLTAPVIDLGIDTGFCDGSTFTINATTPDVSYLWNTGATTSTIDVNTPGLFSVIITNGFGCSDTDAINLIEYAGPVVDLGDDDSYCSGEAILLDATNPDCTYLWNTGATTPTLYITESGTFSVTVTNAQGCSAFDEINIIVNPLPVADLGPDITSCADVPVLLDATTPFCSYVWSTGETTATILVTEPGLYTVAITNSFGCFIIDSIHIFNYAPTAVELTLPFETICNNIAPFTLTGGTPDGGSYSGDGVTDNIFNANEAGAGTHVITYSYTDINGCTTTAEQTITVTICQEVETDTEGSITLYPNPAMNQFIIENTTHQQLENIAIYNANGDLVFSEINIAVGSPVTSVDIQDLPSGYYQVKLNRTIALPLIISK